MGFSSAHPRLRELVVEAAPDARDFLAPLAALAALVQEAISGIASLSSLILRCSPSCVRSVGCLRCATSTASTPPPR